MKETRQPLSSMMIEEIAITPEMYPPTQFITSTMKNKIYRIPREIMPEMRTYEIQVKCRLKWKTK